MDHLKIQKAHIHGYSMGGGITGQLLGMIPDRFITAGFGGSGLTETDADFRAEGEALDEALPKATGADADGMDRFRSRVAAARPAALARGAARARTGRRSVEAEYSDPRGQRLVRQPVPEDASDLARSADVSERHSAEQDASDGDRRGRAADRSSTSRRSRDSSTCTIGRSGPRADVMQKPLLITGGGRGIGAATARLAAARGYAVCVNYRAESRRRRRASSRRSTPPAATRSRWQADVAVEADVVRLFETVRRDARAAHRARQQRRHPRDADAASTRWTRRASQRVFATNVIGAFLCAREAVRRMSTTHGGTGGAIVNVSSGAARLGSPGEYVDYAARRARSTRSPSAWRERWRRKASASTRVRAGLHLHRASTRAAASRIASIASRRSCR